MALGKSGIKRPRLVSFVRKNKKPVERERRESKRREEKKKKRRSRGMEL